MAQSIFKGGKKYYRLVNLKGNGKWESRVNSDPKLPSYWVLADDYKVFNDPISSSNSKPNMNVSSSKPNINIKAEGFGDDEGFGGEAEGFTDNSSDMNSAPVSDSNYSTTDGGDAGVSNGINMGGTIEDTTFDPQAGIDASVLYPTIAQQQQQYAPQYQQQYAPQYQAPQYDPSQYQQPQYGAPQYGTPQMTNQYGQPVNQYGQLIDQYGNVLPNQTPNAATVPASTNVPSMTAFTAPASGTLPAATISGVAQKTGQQVAVRDANGNLFNNGINLQPYRMLIETYFNVQDPNGGASVQVPMHIGDIVWSDAPFTYDDIAHEHKPSFPDPSDPDNQLQRYAWTSVDYITPFGGLIPLRKDTIEIVNDYAGQTYQASGGTGVLTSMKISAKSASPFGAFPDDTSKEAAKKHAIMNYVWYAVGGIVVGTAAFYAIKHFKPEWLKKIGLK